MAANRALRAESQIAIIHTETEKERKENSRFSPEIHLHSLTGVSRVGDAFPSGTFAMSLSSPPPCRVRRIHGVARNWVTGLLCDATARNSERACIFSARGRYLRRAGPRVRDLLCINLRCVYHSRRLQDNDRSMRHARINGPARLYTCTYPGPLSAALVFSLPRSPPPRVIA